MKLGAFSISLSVKDIALSRAFYEKLGFVQFGGDQEQKWLILKNGETLIGLFEGMFPENLLTFNPGWDQNAQNLDDFDDVRDMPEIIAGGWIATRQRSPRPRGACEHHIDRPGRQSDPDRPTPLNQFLQVRMNTDARPDRVQRRLAHC